MGEGFDSFGGRPCQSVLVQTQKQHKFGSWWLAQLCGWKRFRQRVLLFGLLFLFSVPPHVSLWHLGWFLPLAQALCPNETLSAPLPYPPLPSCNNSFFVSLLDGSSYRIIFQVGRRNRLKDVGMGEREAWDWSLHASTRFWSLIHKEQYRAGWNQSFVECYEIEFHWGIMERNWEMNWICLGLCMQDI